MNYLGRPVFDWPIDWAEIPSSFKIRAQEGTLEERPELHVAFRKAGEPAQCAKVRSVSDNPDGTQTVELTEALAVGADQSWHAVALYYVRLADDLERGVSVAEGRMTRMIRVIELPLEYAAYEVGAKPIYLYHFYTLDGGEAADWRFTSFAWDLSVGGLSWLAKRITHGQLQRSTRGDRGELEITAECEEESPLYQLCPCALAMPLYVGVLETDYTDPGTQSVLFAGRVLSVEVKGMTATAKCASFLDVFGGVVPHFYLQPRCNYRVFEPNTCRASPRLARQMTSSGP